jgi:Ca-activated chloride channel family protein
MDLKDFHFAHPLWLLGLLIIPALFVLFFLFYRKDTSGHQLEKFIDRHLLSALMIKQNHKKSSSLKTLFLWSCAWAFLTFALAGPRWNYREIETFSRDQSLVILLDLSESMNAADIKPSRLVRAKQKIEDFINLASGVKIGLIAFAADPHMIAPVTDDKEMIRHLLPSLETDLVYVQGSKLSVALNMAASMLEAEPGSNKALLVISDGGFEDAGAITLGKKLADGGLIIHAMGVGTLEGAPLKDTNGTIIKRNGAPILSRLEQDKLKSLSEAGKGYYLEAHYSNRDENLILQDLAKRSDLAVNLGSKNKLWDERFYLLLVPALLIVLVWFRRGYVFSILPILLLPFFTLEASFKNHEELGKEAFDLEEYETAISRFQDPYRKGVAYYKAGKFAEAEEMFKASKREEVALNAAYNLGNSLAQQQKFQEAVTAYKDVLERWPECTKAKENLELIKSMMQESSDSETGDGKKEGSESKDRGEKEGEQKEAESSDKDSEQNTSEHSESQESNQEEKESIDPVQSEEPTEDKQQKDVAKPSDEKQEEQEQKQFVSQERQDADLWLNRLSNDPKTFLKNKFYIESKKNAATRGVDPW